MTCDTNIMNLKDRQYGQGHNALHFLEQILQDKHNIGYLARRTRILLGISAPLRRGPFPLAKTLPKAMRS